MSVDANLTEPDSSQLSTATATPGVPRKRGGGPRTQEGRDRSKRNALKHGMMSRVVFPEELAVAIAVRNEQLSLKFSPADPFETFLVGEMALAMARLDHCARATPVDIQRSIDRANLTWDDDRYEHVCTLGARLRRDPHRISCALARTKQGTDWMLIHWGGLRAVLRTQGTWDEEQRQLAFDLLGVATVLRNGSDELPDVSDTTALIAVVDGEMQRLRDRQDLVLSALDEATREMAAAGLSFEEDAATSRLQRYEASARRAFARALAELRRSRAGTAPKRERPARKARPEGEPEVSETDFLARRAAAIEELLCPEQPEEHDEAEAPAPIPMPMPMPSRAAERTEAEPRPAVVIVPPANAPPRVRLATSDPRPSASSSPSSPTLLPGTVKGNRRHRRTLDREARKAARRGV